MFEDVVLASSSPRRADLLKALFPTFRIVPSQFDECEVKKRCDLSPKALVATLALGKGLEVQRREPSSLVIAADTMVFLDGVALGKPRDADEAQDMLSALQGRVHEVLTGWCLLKGHTTFVGASESKVLIGPMDSARIAAYIATGSPLDKAGAYGIQDDASLDCRVLEGSRSNVIGLPLEDIEPALRELEKLVG